MERLRSSTLIETVISMGLLGSVLAASGIIYTNVLRSDRSGARTRMALAVAHWTASTDPVHLPAEERVTVDGVDLRITTAEVAGGMQLHFTAAIAGQTGTWECDRYLVP